MRDGYFDTMAGIKHKIDLKFVAKPFRSVPYRASTRMHEIEESEVQKNLDEGLVILATPPSWATL